MKNVIVILSAILFSTPIFANVQDGLHVGSILQQSMQSEQFQAEIKKRNLQDQTADRVILDLMDPTQGIYGLRVTYNTTLQICEVNMLLRGLRIAGEPPYIELGKAASFCN